MIICTNFDSNFAAIPEIWKLFQFYSHFFTVVIRAILFRNSLLLLNMFLMCLQLRFKLVVPETMKAKLRFLTEIHTSKICALRKRKKNLSKK